MSDVSDPLSLSALSRSQVTYRLAQFHRCTRISWPLLSVSYRFTDSDTMSQGQLDTVCYQSLLSDSQASDSDVIVQAVIAVKLE